MGDFKANEWNSTSEQETQEVFFSNIYKVNV